PIRVDFEHDGWIEIFEHHPVAKRLAKRLELKPVIMIRQREPFSTRLTVEGVQPVADAQNRVAIAELLRRQPRYDVIRAAERVQRLKRRAGIAFGDADMGARNL